MRMRAALALATVPVLVTACGEDQPPPRGDAIEAGPACKTEGTIEAEPVEELRAAVAPYMEPGHRLRISERFGDTAEVQLRAGASGPTPATVTLVKTAEGWVVTSIARC